MLKIETGLKMNISQGSITHIRNILECGTEDKVKIGQERGEGIIMKG